MKNENKKGFTLIELLVVVLIIGILASVALPQYQKAVEKSRVAEALSMLKSLSVAVDSYLYSNGYPASEVRLLGGEGNPGNELDIDVSSLECTDVVHGGHKSCNSKNFGYEVTCSANRCVAIAIRLINGNEEYALFYDNDDGKIGSYEKRCDMMDSSVGQHICKSLESQGWIEN